LRYFFRRKIPPFTKVLLIESGSRHLFDALITGLKDSYGEDLEMGLVTCFAGVPRGFAGEVFRIADYAGRAGRKRLYAELAARHYAVAAIICSGESIMMKWKWALGARVPAKIFVLNENGDYFWLDWAHWRIALHFLLFRAGLTGSAAIPALARLLFFPVTLSYLLLYSAFVHLRRKLRTL
jgi:hypothetical protein